MKTILSVLLLCFPLLGQLRLNTYPVFASITDNSNPTCTSSLLPSASANSGQTVQVVNTAQTVVVSCRSNGSSWITSGGTGSGATLQTNGVNNSSQTLLNLVNSAAHDGVTFSVTNTSGGLVTPSLSGTLTIPGGGTGATTQGAAAIAILPATAEAGDIAYWNGTAWVILAGNGSGTNFLQETSSGVPSWASVAGSGTVTSAAETFTGGLISVAGSPITTSGTFALTVAGTSGGVPYFSGASTWASSGVLTANLPVIGGGAGTAPTVGARSGNTTTFATTSGSLVTGDGIQIDASGNLIDSGAPAAVSFQHNGTNNTSQTVLNLQNSAAFNGLTFTFTNGSGGNVQAGFSGTLGNAGLTNSSVTFGATSVSLGSTLTNLNAVNVGPTTAGTGAFTTLAANSTVTFTGLSSGTQVSCLGLNGSNQIVLLTSACGTGGGSPTFELNGAGGFSSGTLNIVSGTGMSPTLANVAGVATYTTAINTGYTGTWDGIHANAVYCSSTNGTTALTCSSPNKTIGSYTTGMVYNFKTDTSNPVSVAVDTQAVVNFKLPDGSTSLPAGCVTTTNPYFAAQYDGSVFRVIQPNCQIGNQSLPAVTFTAGTSRTVAQQNEIVVCTGTCTVTPLVPVAGTQLCVQNDDNISTVVTLAAISGVQYEVGARTSYKTANTSLASGGAVKDEICIVGRDATHYNVLTSIGTWN